MRRKLNVGDVLWFVPTNGRPRNVIVTKVGRKWAQVGAHVGRIAIESWYMDGGQFTSPGRCHESEQEWRENEEADRAWLALCQSLQLTSRVAHDLSIETIREAADLLRVRERFSCALENIRKSETTR